MDAADRRPPLEVLEDPRARRYEAFLGERSVGVLTYARRGRRLDLIHTVTDPDLRGHGIASALVTEALRDARERGQHVRVICPFVESWLERHPEQDDLLQEE